MSGESEPPHLKFTCGFLTRSGSVLPKPTTFHNGMLLHTSDFIIPCSGNTQLLMLAILIVHSHSYLMFHTILSSSFSTRAKQQTQSSFTNGKQQLAEDELAFSPNLRDLHYDVTIAGYILHPFLTQIIHVPLSLLSHRPKWQVSLCRSLDLLQTFSCSIHLSEQEALQVTWWMDQSSVSKYNPLDIPRARALSAVNCAD